jgi:hypothetical protein
MKKIILFLSLSILTFLSHANDIDQFFILLPESYLSQLSHDQRLELIQKVQNGKDSSIINNYGGFSRLLTINDQKTFLEVQLSKQGSFQAKKWSLGDSLSLYAMSSWVCSPACDGIISFFKNNYEPIPLTEKDFPEIKLRDFLNLDKISSEHITVPELENKFDIFFLRFEFEKNGDNIIVINDNKKYMNDTDYEELKPYLKGDRLPLIWKNGSFVKGEPYFEK